jgi:hypothetical protein
MVLSAYGKTEIKIDRKPETKDIRRLLSSKFG